ncbi:MAG: hypothetical protein MJZ50_06995 [Treponema sp.]|nr:hypothetical protein [Treponema sp.]
MAAEKNRGLMNRALQIKNGKKKEDCSQGLLSKIKNMDMRKMNGELKVNAIVENEGIFSIQENLETSGVVQDPELKALVDAVMGN